MRHASDGLGRAAVVLALASVLVAGSAPGTPNFGLPDDGLDDLFSRLREARSAQEAARIEDRIYELWSRSGNAEVDSIFRTAMVAVVNGEYRTALLDFEEVTRRAPHFAEGWNKRASVEYQLGDYEAAVRDIDRTLELERRHFGAMSGRGLIHLANGDTQGALRMFERALSLNPASSGLKRQVDRLRSQLGYRSA
jgi:tetratricopeptide (TPR) repeat protein